MVKIKFRKFTQEEIDNIVCDYKKGMRPKDLEIKYNRNSGTIIGKLKSLGVFKPTKYRFAKDDHDWLKKNYSHANIDVVKEHFSNIPLQSIRSYCSSHHIMMSDFNWTKNDENIIYKYHSEKTLDELYKMLDGRFSKKSIALKRYNLGYSHSRKWADEEIMFLKNNYSFKSMDYILNGLPNRTYDGIVKKAMELNLQKYPKREIPRF